MIEVYGHPQSRSTRVTWMLEELGIEYQFILVDFALGEHQSDSFLSINPGGKIPVIRDGDLVLSESAAIVTYLADKFPDKNLIPPPGTTQRALYEQWSYFAVCELEQALWTKGKHKFALPKALRVPEIFATAEWEYKKALQLVSIGLGNKPYLLGDDFTGVDILIAMALLWGIQLKLKPEQENIIAYVNRLKIRPALSRANAKQDATLNKKV